ncbi:hypothetical protein HAX54_052626 [Datura stramonium]|uniref:Uncharacterized protein n=1 Tax=Datura stramonium TaxID=4076 RepID=A0ABS8WQX4_DATST|nr:hypothetical protein [Datura stramonium]
MEVKLPPIRGPKVETTLHMSKIEDALKILFVYEYVINKGNQGFELNVEVLEAIVRVENPNEEVLELAVVVEKATNEVHEPIIQVEKAINEVP